MKIYLGSILNIILFFFFGYGQAQDESSLQFDEEGEFKIAQFTDLHWGDKDNSEIPWEDTEASNPEETKELIRTVILEENPDLVVLTGDIVTSPPVKKGWLTIGKLFEEEQEPWLVALGNHDGRDAGETRQEVFNIIQDLPYFVGESGKEDLDGAGNYVLPIRNSNGSKVSSLIYVLDSHNRPKKEKYGAWDWIHYNQINWYRQTRDKYASQNNNTPLPSLMFFHIPLPEFSEIEKNNISFLGHKDRGIGAPNINSGLFGSFLERGDMMGVFVGHNHSNDNIGIFDDVALGFGRVTGAEAHSDLERGSRIIKIYQNKSKFDTWIRTRKAKQISYHYPSGITSIEEDTLKYYSSVSINKVPGINYTYFEGGRFKKIEDIRKKGKRTDSGQLDNFSLNPAKLQDSIAFKYEGLLDVPKRAVYRFYTNSDDGSCLYIDDHLVVDNDGSHYVHREDGKIALDEGLHKIKILYFQDYLGKKLEVGWSSRFFEEERIPDAALFRPIEKD